MMRLIDADKIVFDCSGLVYVPQNNVIALASYFFDQIRKMPTIAPSPNEPSNEPLTFGELLKMESEPVWCVGKDKKSRSWWGLVCVEGSTVWVVDSDIRSTLVAWKGKLVDTEIKAVYRRKPDTGKEM